MRELLLAAVSAGTLVAALLLLVGIGWYLVWTCFLSRFRFVRELLGGGTESSTVADLKEGRSKLKRIRKDD